MTRRAASLAVLLADYQRARVEYREAQDFATDPTLFDADRALWRRRVRNTGRRYWRLWRELKALGITHGRDAA